MTRSATIALLFALPSIGCASTLPSTRAMHEVDGEVVYSRPPSPGMYDAYLRARLALDANPPRPDEALSLLERVQRSSPDDPHVWATKAEAHALRGDDDAARTAAERALALSPDHPKARRVLASLSGGSASARATSSPTP